MTGHMLPGESTSAALRRITAERDQAFVDRDNAYDALTDALAERDEVRAAFNGSIGIRARLVDRALTLRSQRDAARAEVETLRHSEGADLAIRRRLETALADLGRAERRAEAAERAQAWAATPTSKEKSMDTTTDGGVGGSAAKLDGAP